MSDTNFGSLWKRILLYAPECPLPLAQEFINTAYSRALAYYPWSQLKVEAEFTIPLAYSTGTVNITSGQTLVAGNSTSWDSSMVGSQIYLGGQAPIYTILDVVTPSIITIDRAFAGTSVTTATYTISRVYIEVPSDFMSWDIIRDVANNWRLYTNFRQGQLDAWDAKRTVSGTPWLVANAPPRIPTTGDPIVRYELWPKVLPGPKTYTYRYTKRPPLLSAASDIPMFPLRGDALRRGALAELALWPGTSTLKNPYYNIDQHRLMEQEFQSLLAEAWRQDQDVSQTSVIYDDANRISWAPFDAAFVQSHDVAPWMV